MVEKLFIVKSPRSLRCSPNIFQCFALFILGPYFIRDSTQGMGLTFFWPMDMDPLGPSGLILLFLSPSQSNKESYMQLGRDFSRFGNGRYKNPAPFPSKQNKRKAGSPRISISICHCFNGLFFQSSAIEGHKKPCLGVTCKTQKQF